MEKIKLTKWLLDKLIYYYYEQESDGFVEALTKLPYSQIDEIHILAKAMREMKSKDVNDILIQMTQEEYNNFTFKVFIIEHPKLDADLVRNIFDYGKDKRGTIAFMLEYFDYYHIDEMYWGTLFMSLIKPFSEEQREDIIHFISAISDSNAIPQYIVSWLFKFDFVED